jgi:hypothetical protein
VADLTDIALSYGARHLPTWLAYEGGIMQGTFRFAEKPRLCDLDPWRRAIGAHSVTSSPLGSSMPGWTYDELRFNFRDFTISLAVIYPAAATTVAGLGVAA